MRVQLEPFYPRSICPLLHLSKYTRVHSRLTHHTHLLALTALTLLSAPEADDDPRHAVLAPELRQPRLRHVQPRLPPEPRDQLTTFAVTYAASVCALKRTCNRTFSHACTLAGAYHYRLRVRKTHFFEGKFLESFHGQVVRALKRVLLRCQDDIMVAHQIVQTTKKG